MSIQTCTRQKMKFNKTETEYNMKSIRFLLLTITTMFIIIAGLMIVLGISVYSHYHNFSFFYESAKSGTFFTPSVLSVLLGLALLVVTLFGFFGSLKESTCMVNLYACFLSLVFIVELVVVVLAFSLDTETIVKIIDVPVTGYVSDPEIQNEIDVLQTTLNCCGSQSYLDYIGMDFTSNHTVTVVFNVVNGDMVTLVVPQSCCINMNEVICTKMRSVGCAEALVDLVIQNITVIGVLGVSVMFVQLLGIIFALLLARCIRKLKSERTFMAWKIKEQLILGRRETDA